MRFNTRKIGAQKGFVTLEAIFLSCLMLYIYSGVTAQNISNNQNNSIWLINGPVYYESNPFAKGSPYLYDDFSKAEIYTCNQTFTEVMINYDILDQKLVLLHSSSGGNRIPIEVNPILIDSFEVDRFVFSNTLKSALPISNPYSLKVNNGEVQMYVSYNKDFIKRYSQNNEFGIIGDTKRTLYLYKEGVILELRSFKSLKKIYGSEWKQINQHIRQNKLKLKKASLTELRNFMNYCNDLK